jgi:hypothetical protein
MNCICGQPITQAAKGRHRKFCSDFCRRSEDTTRKRERNSGRKPQTCPNCGATIEQPATGRPRKACDTCNPPRKSRKMLTAALWKGQR